MDKTSFLSVTTVNLNGIRAAQRRGFLEWLDQSNPDVLLMQEVRAPEDITEQLLGDKWKVSNYPCEIKGRAGVAIALNRESQLSDNADPIVRIGLAEDETPVDSGRWIEVDLEAPIPLTLVSAYFHSGEIGTPKQDAKMAHLPKIGQRLTELLAREETHGRFSIVAGDFNVVRSDKDIKNWKSNHNKHAGVLDEEIVYLNDWVDSGWKDVVRDLSGDTHGPYTWWSWRGKAYDNDTGWRIDYQYVSPQLAATATEYDIFRAEGYEQRFSDHAPLTVRYDLTELVG